MDEYLEGLFERSFEREVVQEERVFNSLSFFVAALALTVNVLGYIATKMPVFRFSLYSLTTYGLMIVAALLMVGVMWALFDGVRQRVYRIPPKGNRHARMGHVVARILCSIRASRPGP